MDFHSRGLQLQRELQLQWDNINNVLDFFLFEDLTSWHTYSCYTFDTNIDFVVSEEGILLEKSAAANNLKELSFLVTRDDDVDVFHPTIVPKMSAR